jgi:predicted dehydrogenase
MNRRHFLQQTSAAASLLGFPAITRSASPNSFLQVASVGVARMGGNTMRSVATHDKVKITALCDVDGVHMAIAVKDFPDASKHKDWRELLSKHGDKFDAITIGTPDHMHAPIAVTALRAKKHVYLQKPMATTIHECRVIAAEAAKAGVVTQLGNQGRSTVEGRMMVELLRTGAVGKIKEIIFWENKKLNWWPKNTDLRPQADPVPGTLAWDLWTGVREAHPYLEETYHPQTWRAWRDFGCGELGDMGCHHFDSSVDGLKLSPPKRMRQTFTGGLKPGMWADAREVEFEFAGNDLIAGDSLTLRWLDGEHAPKEGSIPLPSAVKKFPPNGGLWIGEHGSIFKPYGQRPYLMPEGKYPSGFGKQDHYHNWVDAILAGKEACDPFSHGANLTEIVLCGTLAEHAKGEWLSWDRETQQTNNPAVNALLKREYRDGWKVEGLG